MNNLSVIIKGIFIILISFSAMVFYESCCGIPDFPYYEIESMEVLVENPQVAINDTLLAFTLHFHFIHSRSVSY